MNMADITVGKGATINLGSYESARIDFSITEKDIPLVDIGGIIDTITQRVNLYLKEEITKIEQAAGLMPRGAARFTGQKE